MPDIACPKCGTRFSYPPHHAGKRMECSQCNTVFPIPKDAPQPASSDPKERAEATSTGVAVSTIVQQVSCTCDGCFKPQTGFVIPDGRFICPECHPAAIFQRWAREYSVVEQAQQREEKLKVRELEKQNKEQRRQQQERERLIEKSRKLKDIDVGGVPSTALINCEACETSISSNAKACPKCGHPNSRAPKSGTSRILLLLVGILIFLLGLYLQNPHVFDFLTLGNTSGLQEQVRQEIQSKWASYQYPPVTINSFSLIHKSGNEYEGLLEVSQSGSTLTLPVDVTLDGKQFMWKLRR